MKTYLAYIRVSTVKQGERGSSLQEQKSAIEAYARHHGLQIAGWFEEMETAAKLGRRMFNRMLSELEKGRASGVIIHKIDRSARNLKDWAHLRERRNFLDLLAAPQNESDSDQLLKKFELGNTAQQSAESDFVEEFRDKVRNTTSNLAVRGKEIDITPRFPFGDVAKRKISQYGAPRSATLRTGRALCSLNLVKVASVTSLPVLDFFHDVLLRCPPEDTETDTRVA